MRIFVSYLISTCENYGRSFGNAELTMSDTPNGMDDIRRIEEIITEAAIKEGLTKPKVTVMYWRAF